MKAQPICCRSPFIVVATQNPIEHHGTYPLPESQLDRFMLRPAQSAIPTAADGESEILARSRRHGRPARRHCAAVLSGQTTSPRSSGDVRRRRGGRRAGGLPDAHRLGDARIRRCWISGVCPRGTLALFRAAQALALDRGPRLLRARRLQASADACVSRHRLVVSSRFSSSVAPQRTRPKPSCSEIMKTISVPL
ncbi:MAG: AAA family ATPase [Pyrinomonadaceae bacterium]